MDRKIWLAAAILSVLIMAASPASAQVAVVAQSYTIHWENRLADPNVTWNNTDARCDISVDWVDLRGQTLQTFTSSPSLKASPYSERARDQVITRGVSLTDACIILRLHATCMQKTSPQAQSQTQQNYTKDITPCAGGTAAIMPYFGGIVWNPQPGSGEQ